MKGDAVKGSQKHDEIVNHQWAQEWRDLVEFAIWPYFKRNCKIINENSHLFYTQQECFIGYLNHAGSYDVLVGQWQRGDFQNLVPTFTYKAACVKCMGPELGHVVEDGFRRSKRDYEEAGT
jgi:hypothetical protein